MNPTDLPSTSLRKPARAALAGLILLCAMGCASQQRNITGNATQYLYASEVPAATTASATLQTPIRVGLAFAPTQGTDEDFPAQRKQALLYSVAEALSANSVVGPIEIIPSNYITTNGGFAELQRIRAAFNVTGIILISYEQVQFSDTTGMGMSYWIYGAPAYFVKGERNETRTFVDAALIDIATRTTLCRASGASSLTGSSTLVGVSKALRERSASGFDEAVNNLIVDLTAKLNAFASSLDDGIIQIGI